VVNHTGAIFRQINKDNPRMHHDALEFPDGQMVLLTDVFEGQEATVLQLPAQPITAADIKSQRTDSDVRRSFLNVPKRHRTPQQGSSPPPGRTGGISLRYLQKLFTARGSTCSEFIYSLRLDHAARLLQRRASLATGQPLSEIAYACGFRDYTHFARRFRHRFGYSPGARSAGHGRAGDAIVRASTGESASWAHDV
jgi:AraC-like DNA-binding protein